jgi:hypothetical protein
MCEYPLYFSTCPILYRCCSIQLLRTASLWIPAKHSGVTEWNTVQSEPDVHVSRARTSQYKFSCNTQREKCSNIFQLLRVFALQGALCSRLLFVRKTRLVCICSYLQRQIVSPQSSITNAHITHVPRKISVVICGSCFQVFQNWKSVINFRTRSIFNTQFSRTLIYKKEFKLRY